MNEPSLSNLLEQLVALQVQVSRQQARLAELESHSIVELTSPRRPIQSGTSRRRMLRRLAGGLVAGLAAGGAVLVGSDQPAQARTIINPAGTNNQIGTLVVPPGAPSPNGPLPNNSSSYGLVVTNGANIDWNTILPTGNTAITGYGAGALSNGVYAATSGNNSNGVNSTASGAYTTGVRSTADGNASNGIIAQATGTGSNGITAQATGNNSNGVFASATGPNSSAGVFYGNVNVSGTLSKTSGSFKIDHPLDPANFYLYHSFVESNDMMNIYNGLVTLDSQGTATVELPPWFETLNSDFRYGLTAIGQSSPDLYIAQKVAAGRFKIAGGKPGQEVSWQLTGIRQDEWAKAHRIPVEEAKPDHERGLYLHPELYGQSQEKAVHYRQQPQSARRL